VSRVRLCNKTFLHYMATKWHLAIVLNFVCIVESNYCFIPQLSCRIKQAESTSNLLSNYFLTHFLLGLLDFWIYDTKPNYERMNMRDSKRKLQCWTDFVLMNESQLPITSWVNLFIVRTVTVEALSYNRSMIV